MSTENLSSAEFDQCCDELMLAIEEAIDLSGEDIDYETSAGVQTLTVEANGSKIIISRQPALQQIWVAAKSGGYYFDFVGDGVAEDKPNNHWVCTATKETFGELLQRVCREQGGGGLALML